ncbi:hypothetical protein ACWDSJ_37830 [Nocardia sp. NPDC003482]
MMLFGVALIGCGFLALQMAANSHCDDRPDASPDVYAELFSPMYSTGIGDAVGTTFGSGWVFVRFSV